MATLKFYPPGTTREQIDAERLDRILSMTPNERMHLAFELMALSLAFKKGPIKEPQGKGIVLRKKGI